MMRSIRVRLLVWTVCGMAILLAVFAVAVYEVICRSLLAGYDEVLISTARTIRGFVEQNKAEIKVEIDEHQVPEFNRSYRPDYFQLWREDGELWPVHSRSQPRSWRASRALWIRLFSSPFVCRMAAPGAQSASLLCLKSTRTHTNPYRLARSPWSWRGRPLHWMPKSDICAGCWRRQPAGRLSSRLLSVLSSFVRG